MALNEKQILESVNSRFVVSTGVAAVYFFGIMIRLCCEIFVLMERL